MLGGVAQPLPIAVMSLSALTERKELDRRSDALGVSILEAATKLANLGTVIPNLPKSQDEEPCVRVDSAKNRSLPP